MYSRVLVGRVLASKVRESSLTCTFWSLWMTVCGVDDDVADDDDDMD